MSAIIPILALLILIPLAVIVLLYVLVPVFKAIGWVVRQIFRFVFGEIGDLLRIVGGVLTGLVLVPLVIVNIVIGRWSAAAHFGRAVQGELSTIGVCFYRVFVGHPARLLCLTNLTEGLERRLPEVVAAAPGADRPSRRVGMFEGYSIVGSLPGGGSGSKLYIAEPDDVKRAVFERQGHRDVERVVIKVFSVRDGSSLPQIVRESRALDAAKKLGLVLEHELTDERFFYVTRYVPGEPLTLVTQRLHAEAGDGLGAAHLRRVLGYACDLLETLRGYHRGGLWHKDVKPDNIIVDGQRAHLVDFGLVTPLRSAMTLTTHGTEYFRDPELVRMALKGVKVHQVDGAKFDIYAAGAVLYSMVEGSFPAHGGLSQITRRCPEALRWIVRRSMTEYDKRYASADEMLADIHVLLTAADPFALRPVDLPSMRGEPASPAVAEPAEPVEAHGFRRHVEPVAVGAGSDAAPAVGVGGAAGAPHGGSTPRTVRRAPKIRVADWWTGGYVVDESPAAPSSGHVRKVFPGVYVTTNLDGALDAVKRGFVKATPVPPRPSVPRPPVPRPPRPAVGHRRAAREQVEHARLRAKAARERAHARIRDRRRLGRSGSPAGMNAGVAVSLFLFLAVCAVFVGGIVVSALSKGRMNVVVVNEGGEEPSSLLYASGPILADVREIAAQAGDAVASVSDLASMDAFQGLAVAPGAQVLIVSENTAALSEGGLRAVTVALDRLSRAGFSLVGNFPGNAAAGDELERQLDLAAEVSAVRGIAPLDSPDTVEMLGDWLAADGAADLICWISGEKRGDKVVPQFWLMAPRAHDGDVGDLRERFETALHAISTPR